MNSISIVSRRATLCAPTLCVPPLRAPTPCSRATRSSKSRVLALCLVLVGCAEATDADEPTQTGATGDAGGMGEPEPTSESPDVPSASGGNGAGGAGAGGMNQVGAGGTNAVGECTAEPYAHSFEFGAIFEGWSISTFSTPSLIPMEPTAFAALQVVPDDAGVSDAGNPDAVVADAGALDGGAPVGLVPDASTLFPPDASTPVAPGFTGTLMELDTNEGAPDSPNGALKFTVPFDGPGQLLLIDHVFNTGLNFEGTVVSAKVKLASGLITGPADTATANLVLKSTDSWVYYAGPAVVLDPSADWVTLTLDPDAPPASVQAAGFVACDVREIDIEIHTGATGTFQEAVIYIDSITVAPKTE